MRQLLPHEGPNEIECGVINLGDIRSNGTHWTCYVKIGDKKLYFDSYGNAPPPLELVAYLGGDGLVYNTHKIQNFTDPPICGHLCLEVLRRHDEDWEQLLDSIRDNKYVWKTWFLV